MRRAHDAMRRFIGVSDDSDGQCERPGLRESSSGRFCALAFCYRIQSFVARQGGRTGLSFDEGVRAEGQRRLLYFLGSGHLGTTYLYTVDDFLFESPVAWYSPSQAYDMKPGLAEIDRMPPPLPMQSGCLRCHMSSVQASDPGTINRYRGLPFLHTGITCESCHGDSRKHVNPTARTLLLIRRGSNPIDAIRFASAAIWKVTSQ